MPETIKLSVLNVKFTGGHMATIRKDWFIVLKKSESEHEVLLTGNNLSQDSKNPEDLIPELAKFADQYGGNNVVLLQEIPVHYQTCLWMPEEEEEPC
jgi:hypothetical protein